MTALRLHRRRVAGVAALAFTSALALVARVASAADDAPSSVARARPFDAPDTASDAPTPPLPPGYQLSESNGLRFHYHPVVRERVASLLAKAAKIRAELSARLGLPVLGAVEIRVAPARAEMSQLAPAPVPPFATAVAFSRQRLVVMSLGSADAREPADLEATLRHELAHIALDEAVADHAIPRWVHEGFAADFSGESRASCAEALFSASMHERLVPLDGLDSQLPEGAPEGSLAFAEAVDFARFLGEPAAAPHIGDVARRVREGAAFDAALSTSFGEDA
ncbi:MAG TPA: hypothetical protein VH560_07825, partial [Polyangia bacterium]|nr:hypothetical protein [Polyangia bacterium]